MLYERRGVYDPNHTLDAVSKLYFSVAVAMHGGHDHETRMVAFAWRGGIRISLSITTS
jgi:hypothetical protein